MKPIPAVLLLLALAACRAPHVALDLPHEHPAHPAASASALAPSPDPFTRMTTYALPGSEAGTLHHGMSAPGAAAPDGEVVAYTCPMHPEVVQSEPGTCPACGMVLRPMKVHAQPAEESKP